MIDLAQKPLAGKKGLVLGIANEHSIAYGCAKAFRALDAELAVGYLNEKAKPYAEPLAKELEAALFLACDVRDTRQLHDVFQAMSDLWGNIDFALPGPVKARAASGVDHFDDLLQRAAERAPAKRLVSIEDVGVATAVLATDYAELITGETVHVDGGYHILG